MLSLLATPDAQSLHDAGVRNLAIVDVCVGGGVLVFLLIVIVATWRAIARLDDEDLQA